MVPIGIPIPKTVSPFCMAKSEFGKLRTCDALLAVALRTTIPTDFNFDDKLKRESPNVITPPDDDSICGSEGSLDQ